MTRITLAENDQQGCRINLTPEEAARLAATDLVDVRPERNESWTLLPRLNRVGVVSLGDVDIEVRPKASFASLIFMLGYARDPGFRPDLVGGHVEDELWPLVAETLTRLTEGATARGVLQGYVTRDDAINLVRGRIRTADQMARHHGRPLPLEVTYDEYEVDIPENRILKTALVRMATVPRLPAQLRLRLLHLSGRLVGVRTLTARAARPSWRPTRLNTSYQPALRLSELVLDNLGVGPTVGQDRAASFAVDMAAVFEDFVTRALAEALGRVSPAGVTHGQYAAMLDHRGRVPIRPDIVHTVGGRPRGVFDAKYKIGSSDGRFPVSDVYQMLAYCTALGLDVGTLVYAGTRAGGREVETHEIGGTAIAIRTWPLDVTVEPRLLLRQLQALAESLPVTQGPSRSARMHA